MTRIGRNLKSTAIALAFAVAISFPTAAETRFVLPFSGEVPGAYGSQWVTQTTLLYRGDEAVTISPPPLCFLGECPFSILLPPGLAPLPFVNYGDDEEGMLITISAHGDDLVLKSRVRDLTRFDESHGTEVPVPREDQFRSTPLRLLNIPLSNAFRITVRIYTMPEFSGGEVEIRYFQSPAFDPSSGSYEPEILLLGTERFALQPRHSGGGYAPLVLVSGVELKPELAGAENLWIEMEPISAGMPIYAFASVTNNQSQHVTIVTP